MPDLASQRSASGHRACERCATVFPLWGWETACTACGAPLEWVDTRVEDETAGGAGIWRHARMLPPVAPGNRLSLGEVATPIVPFEELLCKLDYLLPTGSFKDRGAAVLASCALEAGAYGAVADSSGNAGSALAAYFAAAGVPLTVFVPAHASSPKVAQARSYGATVREVDGDRSAVSVAARAFAAEEGMFYASHAWSPFFLAGTRTLALELVAELGPEPPAVVVPVGAGTLLLGLAEGFELLRPAGVVPPPLYGVQADPCAPLADAFVRGLDDVDPGRGWARSVAEGINIASPPRGRRILERVRRSGGGLLAVSEAEIVTARDDLARKGVLAETTSATALAGARRIARETDRPLVVVLTGSGLKEGRP